MHIFGIPRVHRVLLCIWFPWTPSVLTLSKVEKIRAATTPAHQMRTVEDAKSVISGSKVKYIQAGRQLSGTTRKVLSNQLATVSAALWILTAEATHTASN